MDLTLANAVKTLSKLLQFVLSSHDAWKSEGFDAKELTTLPPVLDFIGDFGGVAGTSKDLAALQLALITRCFGLAFKRHWAFNESLAPRLKRFQLFMSKEEKKRAEEIELRVRLATESLKQPGDLPAGRRELRLVESLAGSPLATPYFQALWNAFSNPKLDEEGDEPPLLDLGESGRMEFERNFLLAYQQELASSAGQPLQLYLRSLSGDYRQRLLRELILKDLAAWGGRHIFGNIERQERHDADPIPFMPLEEMYVEPDAGLAEERGDVASPVIDRIERLLGEPKKSVLVVKADFGMGKSLTARTLARRWAHQFLSERTPSPELPLPVFIRCADDLPSDGFELEQTVRRAWKRQASALGLELKASDAALGLPDSQQRTVFLLDGLDEVFLDERRLESFFKCLSEEATDRHRFIIFSRPGALPTERELDGVPVLDIHPWRVEQAGDWLERWRRLNGGMGPAFEELKERELDELAETPILLFMIAQTWSAKTHEKSTGQTSLYEEFFQSIARGKYAVDRDKHPAVHQASRLLRDQLVDRELLSPTAEDPDAMLWLMGRVAWEATKREQLQKFSLEEEAEPLKKHDIENLLTQELKLRSRAAETIESIQVGLLLTMQAHLHKGTASQILFGHKSFRESLVARYWADRLKALARAQQMDWKRLEEPLLGGRLLSREDRAFEFLMDMLNAESRQQRPPSPFGLTEAEHAGLLGWAQQRFASEELESLSRAPVTLREDWRPLIREAALAIGSHLRGSPGLRVQDGLTLRTLFAWFWLKRIGPIVMATKARLQGSVLAEINLRGADFRGANLEGANFASAAMLPRSFGRLVACDFSDANLSRVNFRGAKLVGALFKRAQLVGADFSGAALDEAHLQGASLVKAMLVNASLVTAVLEGADLTDAFLEGANLKHASYDRRTRWPAGFDPSVAGAVYVE